MSEKRTQVVASQTCHGRWMTEECEPGLVSVIIPTYNRVYFLVEAIDSVWAQTYRPIELIVVDDGSTDNTPHVLEEWGKAHSGDPQFELRTFREENKGAPAARNLGLIESRGEYIQFCDSDDVMLPLKLVEQTRLLASSAIAFAACDAAIFRDRSDDWLEVWDFSQREHSLFGHVSKVVLHSGVPLYKRGLLRWIGPWCEDLRRWQDFEYTFRVLASGAKGVWLRRVLYVARSGGERISGAPVAETHRSLFAACARTESVARRAGLLDRRLAASIGARVFWLSARLADEGHHGLSLRYLANACWRMGSFRAFTTAMHGLGRMLMGPALSETIAVALGRRKKPRQPLHEYANKG